MNTNLGTEFESLCLFHKLNVFLLRETVICISVKMAITTKKIASYVFQLIQVLKSSKKLNAIFAFWLIT